MLYILKLYIIYCFNDFGDDKMISDEITNMLGLFWDKDLSYGSVLDVY